MSKFKINPLVLAIAVAMPSAVYAQDEAVDEIVVSGFRESLAKALDIKRDNTGAVDSIIAEDIADFPDNNLAESMQRVPGVNISRSGGEGSQISVRGLSPDFTRVRIDGMETIATGVGNRSRSFDFNIFASELFSRIDVRKSQSAEMDEGSLGATVDLSTGKPLDYENMTVVTSYQQGYNDQSESSDPRFTGLISAKNEDETLGGLFSVAYSKRSVTQEGHNSGRWDQNTGVKAADVNTWANYATLPAEVNNAYHPRFPRQLDREVNTERLGMTASIQWEPTEKTKLSLNGMYADLDFEQIDRTLTPISLSRTDATGRKQSSVTKYEVDASRNALVYAELTGVDVRSEFFQQVAGTKFHQFTVTLDQEITDTLRMDAIIGSSKSKLEVTKESTAIFEKFNQNMTYDYRGREDNPIISYGFDLTNPSSWQLSELRDRPADTTNSNDSARVNFAWDISDVFTLKAGVSSKKFVFENNQFTADRALIKQGATLTAPVTLQTLPTGCSLTLASTAIVDGMGSIYTPTNGQNAFFIPNLDNTTSRVSFYDNKICFPVAKAVGGERSVTEEDTGAHVQLNFKTEIASLPFRGDIGVRQVKTEQTSTGVITGFASPVEVKRDYTDTLPSVNLVLEPIEDVLVRGSWSKVMTRPSLGNLTPGGSLSVFTGTVTSGNPFLEAFRADATDLSVEWYFAEKSLLSVAWFNKKIDSFPQSTKTTKAWSELGLPDSVITSQAPGSYGITSTDWTLSAMQNGGGGKLDGLEVQYEQPLDFIPGPDWLKNFGIKTNYTYITSEVDYGTGTNGIKVYGPLVGQSKVSWNATLWYENDAGFSGRISATYRDPYVNFIKSQIATVATAPAPGYDHTDKSQTIDASMSYKINDNIKVSLDMLNLTNESETTLLSDYDLPDTSLTSGRQYYLGVQYSF